MVARRVDPGTRNHHPRTDAIHVRRRPVRTARHPTAPLSCGSRSRVSGPAPRLRPGKASAAEATADCGDRTLVTLTWSPSTSASPTVPRSFSWSARPSRSVAAPSARQVRRMPSALGPGGRHRHHGAVPADQVAELDRRHLPERAVVVDGAPGRDDAAVVHRQGGEPMQVATLRERDIEEPQLVDVQPLGRRDARCGLPVIEVGAPPPLASVPLDHPHVDDRRPLDEAHRGPDSLEITKQQVVDRDSQRRPELPGRLQVDLLDIRHEPVDQHLRGLVVHLEHRRQVEVQVVAQELQVLDLLDPVQSAGGEERVDAPVDLDAALDVAGLVAPLRDRRLLAQAVDVPAVDHLRNDGEPTGGRHGLEGEQLVLEQQALGEAQAVVPEQGGPVDLVDGDGVVEQVGEVGEALGHLQVRVDLLAPAPDPAGAGVDALGGAAHHVGSRALRSLEEVLARVALVLVVGVAEHHPRCGRQVDAAVARSAAPAGVLGQALVPDARIVLREPPHDSLRWHRSTHRRRR